MRSIAPAILASALSALQLGAAEVRPAPADWRVDPFLACDASRCVFQDPAGANRYVISGGELARSSEGAEVYRRILVGEYEKVLLAGLTITGNQLGVVIARERISIRGRTAFPSTTRDLMLNPTPSTTTLHPKDVEREHRLEVVNPKSGETVKSLDLGAFRPERMSLSAHGEMIFLCGQDLQLGNRQVRLYNARSGKLEYQTSVARSSDVILATDGYTVDGARWRVSEGDVKSERRFNSRDPYSIAEFGVECTTALTENRYKGKAFAVIKFTGADFELGQMLSNGLALKLRNAGLSVVERERMEEVLGEQWTQTTGLTSEDQAVSIGKLANAQYLAFGGLQQAGTTSSLTVRLVSVEEGTMAGGCEVTCRDCRPDDYLEGLDYLVSVWIAR